MDCDFGRTLVREPDGSVTPLFIENPELAKRGLDELILVGFFGDLKAGETAELSTPELDELAEAALVQLPNVR